MRLYIGQVERNDRPAKDGVMSVVRLNHKILIKDQVNYTSPFGSTFTPAGRGGFYSMPSPGQYIMYAETDSIAKDFFYISTVHKDFSNADRTLIDGVKRSDVSRPSPINLLEERGLFPDGFYNVSGFPEKTVIQDSIGNVISLNSVADSKKIDRSINITSSLGKKIILTDSPGGNAIRILNEVGDGIHITGEFKNGLDSGALSMERQVKVIAENNVDVHSEVGKVTLTALNGRGIELTTRGIGTAGMFPKLTQIAGPMPSLPVDGPLYEPYGNIKIDSRYRDLCLVAGKGHETYFQTLGAVIWPPRFHRSRVMLRCYGNTGKVQILSDGSIIIRAVNDSVYVHGGNIHIKGENSVNIHSKGDINMLAGGDIVMSCGDANSIPRVESTTDFVDVEIDREVNRAEAGFFASATIPIAPQAAGYLRLSPSSVVLDGPRIDLAPIFAPGANYPKMAVTPYWELSDYEIGIAPNSI